MSISQSDERIILVLAFFDLFIRMINEPDIYFFKVIFKNFTVL